MAPIRLKTLAKTASYTTSANFAHALAQWLLLVIVVKVFGEITLGHLVLCLSVISPSFLLLSFKLRSLVVTDYHNHYCFEQYMHARLLAQLFTIILLLIAIPFLLTNIDSKLIFSVIAFKVFDGISELSYSFHHKHKAYKTAAQSQILRSITSIIVLTLTATITDSLQVTFVAWALSAAVFASIDLLLARNLLQQREQRNFRLSTLIYSKSAFASSLSLYRKYWPVGLSITFGALFIYVPNYFIEAHHGAAQVGQFAAISYFLVAGGVFINSLSQAATPKLSQLFNEQAWQQFISTTQLLMAIGAILGTLGLGIVYFIGEWLLTLVYNSNIATLTYELQLIFAATIFRYSYTFLGSSLNAMRCFNQQSWVYGAGTISLIFTCALLVPLSGTIGAAQAMFIACIVELAVMLIIFTTQWRRKKLESLS